MLCDSGDVSVCCVTRLMSAAQFDIFTFYCYYCHKYYYCHSISVPLLFVLLVCGLEGCLGIPTMNDILRLVYT